MKSQTISLEAAWGWLREGGRGSIRSVDGFAALVDHRGRRYFIFEAGEPVRFYSLRHNKRQNRRLRWWDEELIFD